MIKVNSTNFQLETQKRIVLYFQSYWCPACESMNEVLLNVEKNNPEISIGQVNSIESNDLVRKLKISAIPALILCENGGMIKKRLGSMTEPEVLEFLK